MEERGKMRMEKKNWIVKYSHKDGRNGTVEATTEIEKSAAFAYGNGKSGMLTVGNFMQAYDLRYNREKNLHMVMLKNYFGSGFVEATEI